MDMSFTFSHLLFFIIDFCTTSTTYKIIFKVDTFFLQNNDFFLFGEKPPVVLFYVYQILVQDHVGPKVCSAKD